MGSSCAVADVQGDKATIWSATQGVWYQRSTAAMVLGIKPENVRVIFTRGSGCYGINGADAVTYDAALLSQAVGKPVRVQLTRKDEMAWENYGNAVRRGRARRARRARQHRRLGPRILGSRSGQPSRAEHPGNVVTGMLAGFEPEAFAARDRPRPSRTATTTTATAFPLTSPGNVGGKNQGHGNHQIRTRAGPQRRFAILDRPAALARAPAKHLRARILHGRDCRARQGRSGRVSPAPS